MNALIRKMKERTGSVWQGGWEDWVRGSHELSEGMDVAILLRAGRCKWAGHVSYGHERSSF